MLCDSCNRAMRRCEVGIHTTGNASFECPKCGKIIRVAMGSLSGTVTGIEVIREGSPNYKNPEEEFFEAIKKEIIRRSKKDPTIPRLLR